MESLRVIGVSLGAAAVACGVSMVVGFAILEVAFSLPFAVVLGILLIVLGVLLLVNMGLSRQRRRKQNLPVNGLVSCMEIFFLTTVGFLTVLGGIFSVWLYFQSTKLPSGVRIFMCVNPRQLALLAAGSRD